MSPRLLFVLPDAADPWRAYNLERGFAAAARLARRDGWDAQITRAPTRLPGGGPLIGGPGSASATAPLRTAYALAAMLRDRPPDVLVAPVMGGLAQPLLMSRAAGEHFAQTAVLLWAEPSTMRRVSADDAPIGPEALVRDALERVSVRLADGLAGPFADALGFTGPLGASLNLRLPFSVPARLRTPTPHRLDTLAFVGPGLARYGARAFVNAVERLGSRGGIGAGGVLFCGPWSEAGPGLSKAWLGRRAQDWEFPFRMLDESQPGRLLQRLDPARVKLVFAGAAPDDDVLIRRALAHDYAVTLSEQHPLAGELARAAEILPADLDGLGLASATTRSRQPPPGGWSEPLRRLQHRKPAAAADGPEATVSVCIVTRDRPDALRRAVASVGDVRAAGVDLVVVDNAGGPDSAAAAAALEADGARVFRLERPVSQGAACNLAAREASGGIVVFLDDDNAFFEGGWRRLATAVALGAFEIAVAPLALYDGAPRVGAEAARLAFLGDAGSAGLLFNGFGDTGLAVRRSVFLGLGGFPDDGGPALDWVFLARARAAGHRIGCLLDPAVAYGRRIDPADLGWRKLDQAGARHAVLEAYAGTYDPLLVARLAQSLSLDTFH